jgi:hypothetical protein
VSPCRVRAAKRTDWFRFSAGGATAARLRLYNVLSRWRDFMKALSKLWFDYKRGQPHVNLTKPRQPGSHGKRMVFRNPG